MWGIRIAGFKIVVQEFLEKKLLQNIYGFVVWVDKDPKALKFSIKKV